MRDHRHSVCCLLPPHILHAVSRNGTAQQRKDALRTLDIDAKARTKRTAQAQSAKPPAPATKAALRRTIFDGGRSETLPEVVTRGFAIADDGPDLIQASRMIVAKTLEGSSPEEMGDWGVMKEKIRADLKRYIAKQTQRRPLIMPVILEV